MNSTLPDIIVNNHIHTPYSFSAFSSVEEAVQMAKHAGVDVLGISDFNTVKGYDEFAGQCRSQGVYPLFNIEFIALDETGKNSGNRWNDPKNPGNMYFCGKALAFPSSFNRDTVNCLASLWKASQDHIWQMIEKCNTHLQSVGLDTLCLDYQKLRTKYATFQVRERHLAQALYFGIEQSTATAADRTQIYRTLFNDESFEAEEYDEVALQNEIRSRLLKYGKPAYVAQHPHAFFPLEKIMRIILDGKGIPCYPVLADGSDPLTEYEKDPEALAAVLKSKNIHAVEFIPKRNELSLLRKYVAAFSSRNFLITFGTEHNTPLRDTLIPHAAHSTALDNELQRICIQSACIYAAHQFYVSNGECGYINSKGDCTAEDKSEQWPFIDKGMELLRNRFLYHSN